MSTQSELYAQAHQNSGYIPSESKENKSDGISEQNVPQTGEEKAGTPSPASVGSLTINTGNLDDIKLKMDTEAAVMPLQQQIDLLKKRAAEYTPETEEQRKKRERRERGKKIIGAVSDGLSALGNLFFTSQYAPNMYNHEKGSQLNSTMAAIEKAKAEREKNDEAYYKLALKIGDLKNQRAKTVREMEAEAEARKIAQQKAADAHEQHEHNKSMWEDEARGKRADADHKENQAGISALRLENTPTELANKNRLDENKINTEQSRQYKYSQQGKNAGSGGGKTKYFNVTDKDGNVHRIDMSDLTDFYQQSDPEILQKWRQEDSYGQYKTPTDDEMRQVVTEHVASKGNTYRKRNIPGKGTTFNKDDYKRNKKENKTTPPPLN